MIGPFIESLGGEWRMEANGGCSKSQLLPILRTNP